MTILTCRKCGVVAQLFGHDALCDTCRLEKWARQRAKLDEIKAAKQRHPTSAKKRTRGPFYRWHTHNPLCGCGAKD